MHSVSPLYPSLWMGTLRSCDGTAAAVAAPSAAAADTPQTATKRCFACLASKSAEHYSKSQWAMNLVKPARLRKLLAKPRDDDLAKRVEAFGAEPFAWRRCTACLDNTRNPMKGPAGLHRATPLHELIPHGLLDSE